MMGREGIVFAVVSFSFSNATSSGGRLSFFPFILLFSGSSFSLAFFFFLSRVHSLSLVFSFSCSAAADLSRQTRTVQRQLLYSRERDSFSVFPSQFDFTSVRGRSIYGLSFSPVIQFCCLCVHTHLFYSYCTRLQQFFSFFQKASVWYTFCLFYIK